MFLAMLGEHSEGEIARMYRKAPEEYERLFNEGERFFNPPRPEAAVPPSPSWAGDFFEEIDKSRCLEVLDTSKPLQIDRKFTHHKDHWSIDIYPVPLEAVGGPDDGRAEVRPFIVNLERLRAVFDEIGWFGWANWEWYSPHHAPLALQGAFQGEPVLVLFHARPREDATPVRYPGD